MPNDSKSNPNPSITLVNVQVSSEVDSMEELEITDCGDDAKDDYSDDENKYILSNDRKSE